MKRIARMSALALALGFSVLAGAAGPAPVLAQDAPNADEAERLAREGLDRILQALGLLLQTIPQYAPPEVQPNGDILIRRLNPKAPEETAPDQPEETNEDGTDL